MNLDKEYVSYIWVETYIFLRVNKIIQHLEDNNKSKQSLNASRQVIHNSEGTIRLQSCRKNGRQSVNPVTLLYFHHIWWLG